MKTFANVLRYAPLACTIFLSACSKDDITSSASIDLIAVKVLHAAPFNKAKVEAQLSGQKLGDVEYGTNTPDYTLKVSGNGTLTLKDAATQADLFTVPQPIQLGQAYSLFIYNPTASSIGALVTTDLDASAQATGRASIRLVNLGFDAGAVTLTPQAAGATPLIANIGYGGASPFVLVDAKEYVLSVQQAASPEAVLVSKTVTLAPGSSYTVLLRGRNSATAPVDEQLALDLINNKLR
ncbi:DUF4397 domain-containing protein [Hymenobacter terrenus]|uniref:DUF4397 domain-containing protein n=1 Tax=Hymenobacter terrenus TaxID=1629124 RepID=UPI0006197B5C|nr:DUF4397 domain-containing protein [Hymenobacter terrenus]